jgi:short-subunit dehydrogenase
METIKNKNILVVGATGGIGSELVKLLKSSGANLFITGRNENKLNQIALQHQIEESCCYAGDLTQKDNIIQLNQKYFNRYTTIDFLINASGIGIIKSSEQLTEEEFLQTLMLNVYSPFMIIKSFWSFKMISTSNNPINRYKNYKTTHNNH